MKPYKKNAKKHPQEQIDNVAKSIELYGFTQPIVIDGNNEIIIGHCRALAAKQLKLDVVPCVMRSDLTDEQVKQLRIVDNKTNESPWDMELLKMEIDEIDFSGFDFDFGFDEEEQEVQEDDFDVDEALDEAEEPTAKLGDIWQLGRHRLMCGDSTDSEQIKQLMGGVKADIYLSDPPYNVAYEGATKDKLTIQNDNMSDSSFREFLVNAFFAFTENLKAGGAFYIFHADSEGYNFRGACQDNGLKVRQCLIWVKNSIVMGRQDYHWKHEPILYGWKDGEAHYWNGSRKERTTITAFDMFELRNKKKEDLLSFIEQMWCDKEDSETTIIYENKPLRNAEHPTMKPIKLISRLLLNSSKQSETVLDTFGGSGSTLIACEQTNRTCYMCELDPKYVDVIIKRWEQFTGQKAVLINN